MTKLSEVTDPESLINYLKFKGHNHKYYYHYTTWDSFEKIMKNQTFLLTKGNVLSINDQHEAKMKGKYNVWDKTYSVAFPSVIPKIWQCGDYTDYPLKKL